MLNGTIYVALGGAIGASLRHLLGIISVKILGSSFPIGTMCANIIGSFLMGCLTGWLALRINGGESLRLFLGVGLLGGFTTFSAFSLDAVLLYQKKSYGALAAYVSGSLILSLCGLLLGLIIIRKILIP